MKILHVLSSPRAEGTPRLVLDWLSVKEFEQEILFLSHQGELKKEFDGQPAWKYYNESFVLGFKSISKIIDLTYRITLERQPDVVIAWMTGFSPWVHLGAWKAGVKKLIVHVGNPPGKTFTAKYVFSYLVFWVGRLLGNKAITCSNYILKEYMRIPFMSRNQFFKVYNCFQPDKFISTRKTHTVNTVIMVATMENHKDHATLLNAWKFVEKKSGSCQLQLAGDGRLKRELEDLANTLGLQSVQFLGSRSDIAELLAGNSVFVLSTTTQEGFGTVLLEALASGCQVIASDVPACREVLQEGRFGVLVEPSNAKALAEAIMLSFENPLKDRELEEQRCYSELFSPEKMIEAYLSVVNSDAKLN